MDAVERRNEIKNILVVRRNVTTQELAEELGVSMRTIHKERIEQNINVFDFELTEDEMKQIAALETGHTEIIDHYDWKTAEFLNTVKGRE